jgi:hypothetical protein
MRKSANDAVIERRASLTVGELKKNATEEWKLNRGVEATIPKVSTTVEANDLRTRYFGDSPAWRSRGRRPNESFQFETAAERSQP